jgi:hypothetical protein
VLLSPRGDKLRIFAPTEIEIVQVDTAVAGSLRRLAKSLHCLGSTKLKGGLHKSDFQADVMCKYLISIAIVFQK